MTIESNNVHTELGEDEGTGSTRRRTTAEAMAAKQRDISVSEFFTKNRHLLGFDNPQKALLTAVKEAVDNSLDACEEAGILPTLTVKVEEVSEGRYRMTVEDNGPGIVKAQIANIFAKLLYGSKFHRLKQSRGQQGIGISAAGMYGQLTTGKPIVISSKTGKGRPAHLLEVRIDARTNKPEVLKDDIDHAFNREHGTTVSIEMAGLYRAGRASVQSYLEQTVVANPHLELTFVPPTGEPRTFPRASEDLPRETQEIKPHPYGVELGMLIKSFQQAGDRSARDVLVEDYSQMTPAGANELLRKSNVDGAARASRLEGPEIESIHRVIQVSQAEMLPVPRLFKKLVKREDKFVAAMQELGRNFPTGLIDELTRAAGIDPVTLARKVEMSQLERFHKLLVERQVRILPPPVTCVAPMGEELIEKGLRRRFEADFFASHTRAPAVYRGNPFVVEVGVAYGGKLPKDASAELLRFANRVPLLYQPRACATTEAVLDVAWKTFVRDDVLDQRKGELPVGPLAIFVHLSSVWVPFTSEAKEAIASYDEITEEIVAALKECAKKLGTWVNALKAERVQLGRKSLFEKYIHELSAAIGYITGISAEKVKGDFIDALPNHVKLSSPTKDESAVETDGAPPPSYPPPGGSEDDGFATADTREGERDDAGDAFEEEEPEPEPEPVKQPEPVKVKAAAVKSAKAEPVTAPAKSTARKPARDDDEDEDEDPDIKKGKALIAKILAGQASTRASEVKPGRGKAAAKEAESAQKKKRVVPGANGRKLAAASKKVTKTTAKKTTRRR